MGVLIGKIVLRQLLVFFFVVGSIFIIIFTKDDTGTLFTLTIATPLTVLLMRKEG